MTVVCTIKRLFTAYLTNLGESQANLALTKIINCDLKVSCKLKLTFKIVNYNCGAFIVKATGD
jgi:hypothetical protein